MPILNCWLTAGATRLAPRYDEWAGIEESTSQLQAEILARFAKHGRALEIGVGTGRVALPLSKRGVEVFGVDISGAMLDVLRKKIDMPTFEGCYLSVPISVKFALVYAVFNTFYEFATAQSQSAVFERTFKLLEPGGCFLIEAFLPSPSKLAESDTIKLGKPRDGNREFVTSHVNHLAQTVSREFYLLDCNTGKFDVFPNIIRYVWLNELDLMAALAGFRLRSRWSDWQGSAVSHDSIYHISIFEKPAL
jgi:SAM-dependent methyltransferase